MTIIKQLKCDCIYIYWFLYRTFKNREKRLRDCMRSSLNTIFHLIQVSKPNHAYIIYVIHSVQLQKHHSSCTVVCSMS